ncbi:Diheme cytochrome c-type [Neorhizobium galegae bv. officinalis bv. officinalis str. HAMBI 1141]|uniref:Diheme cytochrome c-type n=2 Tax=Neorhizobium galegae TaxID=399 RepID=A0A068T828_NEOGA|nr:Diheme cytochrome c-type [Neorhizobium galegae bv. officinalis bv. officinalis str. HAMBI 1141]
MSSSPAAQIGRPRLIAVIRWNMRGGTGDIRWASLIAAAAGVVISIFFGLWWVTAAVPRFNAHDPALKSGDATRGRQVFAAGSCAACHAMPGQPDPLKLGGGLALASPFGTFRVPNISSDPTDGIGSWSVGDLANALVAGVSPAGQHYYPAFPYSSYTGMRLEDIEDLYAYLKTLPAVSGRPPPHDLPLLFRFRRGLGLWKLLFFEEGRSKAGLNGDPVHDRGAYLTETLGHCAECHSTRNALGAIEPETRFAGGIDPEGTGFVPNITPNRIGQWSEAEIAVMLQTGETPGHGRVGSSMLDVVANFSLLPQSDRDAVARYVKSLPPRPTPHP